MAQRSILWTTGTTGDGTSAYTESDVISWLRRSFIYDPANEGVHVGVGGDLAPSVAGQVVTIAPGGGYVYGFPYESTANEPFTVPQPVIGTTGHRIILRGDWSTKLVRLALLSSNDGVPTPPALTQTAGTKWEISLCSISITTGGVVTLTDTRAYLHYNGRVATRNLDDGLVTTVKLANDSVDDTKVGARVPQYVARQGGNATDWGIAGTTNYTPGAIRMQSGVIVWTGASASSGAQGITLPIPLSNVGSGWVSVKNNANNEAGWGYVSVGTTGATIWWKTATATTSVTLWWFAFGPE